MLCHLVLYWANKPYIDILYILFIFICKHNLIQSYLAMYFLSCKASRCYNLKKVFLLTCTSMSGVILLLHYCEFYE